MNKKITKFLFGVHLHQPVDNFKEAVDEATNKCYRPFFKTVKKFPGFKFTLHCSGWLFETLKNEYEDIFDDIKYLNQRGNIEFFTAGFYEPVLCSIPSEDRVEQIKKLNTFLNKEFNQTPKGLWLTERVWEDEIINDLSKCEIKYTMVDDYHFIASGFNKDNLRGYYLTENGGNIMALFPINKELRYALPFYKVDDAITKIKENEEGVSIIFDDAEKFGLWPGTYEWVYKDGWLENFLSKLENDDAIQTVHFKDFFEKQNALGLAYLQNNSYEEMGEWSLKSDNALKFKKILEETKQKYKDEALKFVKGGTWKNFFVKYEESNRIHKMMTDLSKNKTGDKNFLDNLYKAQTNDTFWHGVFGGIYLPNLRDNAYSYITACENIRYQKEKHLVDIKDINLDGYEEAKCVTKNLIAIFESKNGGTLGTFLLRDKCFNIQNSLTRREEVYHNEILNSDSKNDQQMDESKIKSIHEIESGVTKEIKESLYFDWYLKNSFVDHISNESFTLENFKKCKFWEYGDFANQPFKLIKHKDKVSFKREGGIYFDQKYSTTIEKSFKLGKSHIKYNFKLLTKSDKEYIYALEFNLHFADLDGVLLSDKIASSEIKIENTNNFTIKDSYLQKTISYDFDKNFTLLSFPLKTVSKSEKGFDLTIQGVSFALLFPFSKRLEISAKVEIEDE